MAKDTSFAAKVAKAQSGNKGDHCPECDETYNTVKFITSEQSGAKGSWKFNQKFVQVCKCNQAEIYG